VTSPLVIDLHTHSNASDGTLTPAELVQRAAGAGIEVLALTDHDTVDGLAAAASEATRQAIRLVPGVELSATWRAQAIHVLGLWIDPTAPELVERLASQAERRRRRMATICARLSKLGLPGAELLATVSAQPGLPTRAHLAEALLAGGHVGRLDDAFRKYLGKGKPGHVAAEWPALAQIVTWIREAGGIASLAHPARYALSSGARRQMLTEFAAAGGAAVEVVTGGNGAQHVESSAMLAVKYDLAGSVGSDFHSPNHPWNPLGRLAKLPPSVRPVWHAYGL
jgi:predicted metal-dependent phosphoesterase TrpH